MPIGKRVYWWSPDGMENVVRTIDSASCALMILFQSIYHRKGTRSLRNETSPSIIAWIEEVTSSGRTFRIMLLVSFGRRTSHGRKLSGCYIWREHWIFTGNEPSFNRHGGPVIIQHIPSNTGSTALMRYCSTGRSDTWHKPTRIHVPKMTILDKGLGIAKGTFLVHVQPL
jgi:Tfp pilus assembly protein PilX